MTHLPGRPWPVFPNENPAGGSSTLSLWKSDVFAESCAAAAPKATTASVAMLLARMLPPVRTRSASVSRCSAVERVQVVEERGAALEPRLVIRVGRGHPGDDLADAGRLLPAVLRVLHVHVVDDLRDGAERRLIEPEALDQHLERAEVALVGELRLEHVEAQLALLRLVSLRRHELEARLRVDELPDEPSARHPIDLDPGPRDPRSAPVLLRPERCLRCLLRLHAGLHARLH